MKCSRCGAVIESEDAFCPECGKPLGQEEPVRNMKVVIISGVIFLLTVLGLGIWVWNGSKEKEVSKEVQIEESQKKEAEDADKIEKEPEEEEI